MFLSHATPTKRLNQGHACLSRDAWIANDINLIGRRIQHHYGTQIASYPRFELVPMGTLPSHFRHMHHSETLRIDSMVRIEHYIDDNQHLCERALSLYDYS